MTNFTIRGTYLMVLYDFANRLFYSFSQTSTDNFQIMPMIIDNNPAISLTFQETFPKDTLCKAAELGFGGNYFQERFNLRF